MESKGWLYDTETLAADAIAAINANFGIPVSPDAVTRTYTDYVPWIEQWAILYDESLEPVLGSPIVLPHISHTPPDLDI